MLELERMLAPHDGADPCGADLEYDPALLALEQLLATAGEGDGPDWRQVRTQALELLARGDHLRVAVWLALAELQLSALPGFADALRLVDGLIDKRWAGLWPRPDPDEPDDFTERLNILASLSPSAGAYQDALQFPQRLQRTAFLSSRRLGRLDLRSVMLANGEIPPAEGEVKGDPALVRGIIAEAASEDRAAATAAAEAARAALRSIAARVQSTAGATLDFARLDGLLKRIADTLALDAAPAAAAASPAAPGQPAPAGGLDLSGEIASRQQALLALEKVIRYYERNEPGHPAPLMLQRARRLAAMNFAEILRELVPESVDKAGVILGTDAFAVKEGGG